MAWGILAGGKRNVPSQREDCSVSEGATWQSFVENVSICPFPFLSLSLIILIRQKEGNIYDESSSVCAY